MTEFGSACLGQDGDNLARLFWQIVWRAAPQAFIKLGDTTIASKAIMPITTISSVSVNARFFMLFSHLAGRCGHFAP